MLWNVAELCGTLRSITEAFWKRYGVLWDVTERYRTHNDLAFIDSNLAVNSLEINFLGIYWTDFHQISTVWAVW